MSVMNVAGGAAVPQRAIFSAASSQSFVGTIDSRRFMHIIVAIAITILLLGYCRELYVARFGLETVVKNLRHIDLDSEGTLPSWFSSGVLLICSGLLAAIAILSRRVADKNWPRWTLLAAVFLALSIDEATAIHEIAITPLRNAFGLSGVLHFSWVIPATVVVAGLGLYFLPFLFRLRSRYAIRFILAGMLFVGGALGMELVSGYHASHYGMQSFSYIASAMTEETMEIAGSTLFCASLFAYLRECFGGWSVAIN